MLTMGLISGEVHSIAIDQLQYDVLVNKTPIESYPSIRYTLDWIFFIWYLSQSITIGLFIHKSKLLHVIWSNYFA